MNADIDRYTEAEIEAALAACASEPVHIPGAIQDLGILLVFDEHLRRVRQVSANVERFTGLSVEQCLKSTPEQLLGRKMLSRLQRGLVGRERLPGALTGSRRLLGRRLRVHLDAFRSERSVVVELEVLDGGTRYRWLSLVNSWIAELVRPQSQDEVLDRLAEAARGITGYDRALVYVFDAEWNGRVVAESGNGKLPGLLGHQFPASDIPPQVRALYDYNRLRVIANCHAPAVPLVPARDPDTGRPLDLALSTLRAVSPVHARYMANMNVSASLSVAIFSDTGLWGLVACHNAEPVSLSPSARDGAATLVQVASQRLFLLKAEAEEAYRQRIHAQRVALAQGVQGRQGPTELVHEHGRHWLSLFGAQGLALVYLGKISREGKVPAEPALRRMIEWLEEQARGVEPWYTASLGEAGFPEADDWLPEYCGLLAMPLLVDMDKRGWLLFFRPERVATIQWAGRPDKVPERVEGRLRLSPRASFDAWREQVRGMSDPWLSAQVQGVRDLGDDLAVTALAHEIARLNDYLSRERRALAEANEHLEKVANTDALTGILNRYRIEHLVQMSIAKAERYDLPFSLLLFDLDHFKEVNDTHGHPEGDRILRELVACLERGLREADQLGRWGGEEFLLLAPHTTLSEAEQLAERLRMRVAETSFGLEAPVTVSMGVAQCRPGDTLKTLVARADRALYRAKDRGRNCVALESD